MGNQTRAWFGRMFFALLFVNWLGCAPRILTLSEAIQAGDLPSVEAAMKAGKDRDWTEVLFEAIDGGCVTEVGKLAIKNGADVNALHEERYFGVRSAGDPAMIVHSGLELAINKECYELAKTMIESGAKINRVDSSGSTMLIALVRNEASMYRGSVLALLSSPSGREETVRQVTFLISHGADINVRDRAGRTALDYAMGARGAFTGNAERGADGRFVISSQYQALEDGESAPEGFKEFFPLQRIIDTLKNAGATF
jgi:ankyrin repeat protein